MSHQAYEYLAKDLYQSEADCSLGAAVAIGMLHFGVSTPEASRILQALRTMSRSKSALLFADCVSLALAELYPTQPKEAELMLTRLTEFLSKCGSLEEFDAIVSKSTHIPPTQNN